MPADHFRSSGRVPLSAAERASSDLVPDILDTGVDRLPSSGQFSAASISGLVLFALELFAAPLTFGITLVVSVLFWWMLDQPWSGRRKRTRRRGITSRLLYLSTILLIGMWLTVMLIFRASDPTLSSGFSATLPTAMFGVDIGALSALNGMRQYRASTAPIDMGQSSIAPFSLFAHGVASTIAISLLAYSVVLGRRRLRRRLREAEMRGGGGGGASRRIIDS